MKVVDLDPQHLDLLDVSPQHQFFDLNEWELRNVLLDVVQKQQITTEIIPHLEILLIADRCIHE